MVDAAVGVLSRQVPVLCAAILRDHMTGVLTCRHPAAGAFGKQIFHSSETVTYFGGFPSCPETGRAALRASYYALSGRDS